MKTMTRAAIVKLVRELDRSTLDALIAEANHEDRQRFEQRCMDADKAKQPQPAAKRKRSVDPLAAFLRRDSR